MADDEVLARARTAQSRAARPDTSVWVSANAGSGKTHVLVDRLARLMLSGTPPSRILCLTFTNAAAAEMQNRLFGRLADWALAPEGKLAETLGELEGRPPGAERLALARRLFATALESPGGLKIHTIHAFCTRLLQRFPLEAGVAPNFRTLDERGQAEVLAEVREAVMAEAAGDPGGDLARALGTVSSLLHDMGLDGLIAEILKRRRIVAAVDGTANGVGAAIEALSDTLGATAADRNEDAIVARHFSEGRIDRTLARAVADHLATGTEKSDVPLGVRVAALAEAGPGSPLMGAHIAAFCTKEGKPRSKRACMTADLRGARPDLAEWVDGELERAADLHRSLAICRTLAASQAALTFGAAVLAAYERAKREATLLDYDDLIFRARALLSERDDREWVLYKLDGGIDHILVDEAQDTSPEQWEIVGLLAEDMVSGDSSRGTVRTVFAVGDEKQSIFSFQGARPDMFATMRTYFDERVNAAEKRWDSVPMEVSFRSAPEILRAVDAVFTAESAAAGLTAEPSPIRHIPRRRGPGRVELWPVAEVDEETAPDPWTVPVDAVRAGDPKIVLARQIADEIALWLSEGRELAPLGRPIRPGDILILVRRRNAFVDAMVRELKARNVPVAGVDRMRLTEQLAVEDLIALARFATMPEDDYALACVLKSPLVGLGEEDLLDLAGGRGATTLWRALQSRAEDTRRYEYEAARDMLAGVLAMAGHLTPFAFFSRFLAERGRRSSILARLGIEAADPVEELVDAALRYESTEIATLDGFLAWLTRGDMEIKRDMDHGSDEVRVMTVHGAKGLESSIVFLPDTCSAGRGRNQTLLDVEISGRDLALPVWSQPKGALEALDLAKDRQSHTEAEEYRRLLYVGMTRARDWLIVAGYQGKQKRPAGCWYDLVEQGLRAHFPGRCDEIGEQRLRFTLAALEPGTVPDAEQTPREAVIAPVPPPDWARREPAGGRAPGRLRPSAPEAAPGAPALSPLAEARQRRYRRGTLIHALLQHLPSVAPDERAEAARRYLKAVAPDLDATGADLLVAETEMVLTSPDFAPFLAAGARSEVPFTARLAGPAGELLVEGRVDRLLRDGEVLRVLDFKTHRPSAATPAEVPAPILRQMALYRAALSGVFSAGEVRLSILWTDEARMMALPGDLLDRALSEALAGAPAA